MKGEKHEMNNFAERLLRACQTVIHSQYKWSHSLAKEKEYFHYPFNGEGCKYEIGDRELRWITENHHGEIHQLVVVLANKENGILIPLWTYQKNQQKEPQWLHEGPWCDMFETFITEVETVIQNEINASIRAFRLPSVFD